MRVFIIAGELSGDKLGGALMAGLKQIAPEVRFDGVGGPLMQAQGLTSRFDMTELSVMGLTEILPKYLDLRARLHQMIDAVIETQPDVLLTIDSPDFCLRVAKGVKAKTNIKTIHYVAPTVWAWRPGRAAKMAKTWSMCLALFPFEPPYMEAAGMTCDFVGHPVVQEPVATDAEATAFRASHDVSGPLILALPGSRKGEVARLSDRFGAALGQIAQQHRDATFVVPCAEPVMAQVRAATQSWPVTPVLIPGHASASKRAAFKAADVALAASGTVSLELAASATPMVIAYDMAPLSRMIIGRMLRVDTVTLVNLVSDTRVVPEFIGRDCVPEAIANGVIDVLAAPDSQLEAMDMTMDRLGRAAEEPGLRAAKSVLSALK
ncbi:MAG: lipid-A-disaccharide synthase [Pseudomonadota bacterium]